MAHNPTLMLHASQKQELFTSQYCARGLTLVTLSCFGGVLAISGRIPEPAGIWGGLDKASKPVGTVSLLLSEYLEHEISLTRLSFGIQDISESEAVVV